MLILKQKLHDTPTRMSAVELPDWVISLAPSSEYIYASTAKGTIHQLPLNTTKWPVMKTIPAHAAPIHKLQTDPVNDNILYSCSDDATVKIWDSRTPLTNSVNTLTNSRNLPFFSLDVNHGLISAGSQLKGTDSELVLWDLRKLDTTLRSFIDSHNDDITETKFHPTLNNLLLSGSTDGLVNIYNLDIVEEDDALFQCINYNSVHSAGFLTPNRIYILSHMETFGVFDLSTQQEFNPEDGETKGKINNDKDHGDIRSKWDCEYVVDLYAPGYIACGSNSEEVVKLYEFDPIKEDFLPKNRLWTFAGGHGDEIVRDIKVVNGVAYTAGEDNHIRAWNCDAKNTERWFFKEEDDGSVEERMDIEYDARKKEKKEKKEKKKDKKGKKKTSTSSKNKKHRFKPY